jgi:predicted nuclease with TOPRIM domain
MALKDFNLNDALTEELSGLSGSFERIKIPAAGMTVGTVKNYAQKGMQSLVV